MSVDTFHCESGNMVYTNNYNEEDILNFGFDFTNSYFLEGTSSAGSSNSSSSGNNTNSGLLDIYIAVFAF